MRNWRTTVEDIKIKNEKNYQMMRQKIHLQHIYVPVPSEFLCNHLAFLNLHGESKREKR